MNRAPHRNDLGDFLRARRAELTPDAVGLPQGGSRRVAGLRREEVAVLASISTDYYARLEQGRIAASPAVLAMLAQVLRLDDDQRTYLYELAAKADHRPPPRRTAGPTVQPQLQHMLDAMTYAPAWAFGPRTEIVAWNAMAAALVSDFARIPEKERYYIRLLVTDPAMRELYTDWEGVTRLGIAHLRMHNAAHPGDEKLADLVGELSVRDAQFRTWWAAHDVASRGIGTKHLRHPVVGDLDLDWSVVTWGADPDLQVIVWTAPPGTESFDRLRLLASWAADPARAVRGSQT